MHTMLDPLLLRGTDQPAQELVPLRAGPLTAVLDGVDLRYVKLGEVELVRRIYAAVRDQNWNTIPGVAADREIDVREDAFDVRFEVRHANDELDFSWQGTISGTADGRMSFSLDGRAERDFPYNRIGFCVLHPWRETAGARYRGLTPDGPVEGQFPLSVGPQDFVDGLYVSLFPAVSRLELDIAEGITALFEFEGDLFECEDQRNWTDASFKTYCTPLALGLPNRATAGMRVAQTVTVSTRGAASVAGVGEEKAVLTVGRATGATVPPLGLGLPEGAPPPSEREARLLRALGPAHLHVAVRSPTRRGPRSSRGASRPCAASVPPSSWPCSSAKGTRRSSSGSPRRLRESISPASSSRRKAPGRPRPTRRRRRPSCASSESTSDVPASPSPAAPTCTSAR
jgi:D-apionolactonase